MPHKYPFVWPDFFAWKASHKEKKPVFFDTVKSFDLRTDITESIFMGEMKTCQSS